MNPTVKQFPYFDSALLFERVADEPWAMMFDSGVTPHQNELDSNESALGRFDVLLIRPTSTLVFDGFKTIFNTKGIDQALYGEPLAILQAAIPNCNNPESLPYVPGAFGYFSYDLARQYEHLPNLADDDEGLPHMAIGIFNVVLVVDHHERCALLVSLGDDDATQDLLDCWQELIADQLELGEVDFDAPLDSLDEELRKSTLEGGELEESLEWQQYQLAFATVRQYTKNGDCYQVNLTNRFKTEAIGDPWDAYRALRYRSAAPFGCYMNLPFAQILSNSPESFIRCRDRLVTTSPIKGTAPRFPDDPEKDLESAAKLQLSDKDRAENLMIVDLMRNDLSRACELGSVKVPELFALHSFANVHHLISTVQGRLKQDYHALDLLRVCFPGGSITGAPKIRAMEIIEELEPFRRGLYCGSIGYIGGDGNMETNIAIRTIVVKDGVARFSAGGGLVIDSEVEAEHRELKDKASAMIATVTGDA